MFVKSARYGTLSPWLNGPASCPFTQPCGFVLLAQLLVGPFGSGAGPGSHCSIATAFADDAWALATTQAAGTRTSVGNRSSNLRRPRAAFVWVLSMSSYSFNLH